MIRISLNELSRSNAYFEDGSDSVLGENLLWLLKVDGGARCCEAWLCRAVYKRSFVLGFALDVFPVLELEGAAQ